MISTGKVVGFYTDVFGDEVYEYEMIGQYSVCYKGIIFAGDTDGYNTFNTDSFEKAMNFYKTYSNFTEVYIKDNEYGLIFTKGEWN